MEALQGVPKSKSELKLPTPAVNLARRFCHIASQGDGHHKIELVIMKGVWGITVNGGKLEILGKI